MEQSKYEAGRRDAESCYQMWGEEALHFILKYKPVNSYERGKLDRARELKSQIKGVVNLKQKSL